MQYVIWDSRSRGDNAVFWRPNGQGYTTSLDEAGRYSETEAQAKARARPTDRAVPLDIAERLAARRIRIDDLVAALE